MGFDENKNKLIRICKGRKYTFLYEGQENSIFLKDEKLKNNEHQMKILEEVEYIKIDKYAMKIENSDSERFLVLPLDGGNGLFKKSNPRVSNEKDFKYDWITDFKTRKKVTKNAGACDCLILTGDFHFFEFKTNAFDIETNPNPAFNPVQANQHRESAEKQLARTITFFKEEASKKKIALECSFFAVIVALPTFPNIPTNIVDVSASLMNRKVRFWTQSQSNLIEISTENPYKIS